MTAAERAVRDRIRRRAGLLVGPLVGRELAVYELIRRTMSETELVAAIASGTLDAVLDGLLSERSLNPLFATLRAHIDAMTLAAAGTAAHVLPSGYRTAFDVLSPTMAQAVRQLDDVAIRAMAAEVRETVRQHALAGLEAGTNPRHVARGMRRVIGLAPNQEQAVRNFEAMLRAGDPTALKRRLRDRRFDGTLRKAFKGGKPLSDAQIARMTDVYRKRMIAFNAESHARTIALNAQRLANRLAWQNSVEQGFVATSELTRQWIAVGGPTGDGRNRPEHLAMHGEIVGFEQPYSNGQMVPGESDWSCRCAELFLVRPLAAEAA
jgi:hypothetical protein